MDRLRILHETELEILLLFKSICEEYSLTYYLTAGTLLGAVRHKGFIPWDDDIDVAMPRKDYDKFCEIAQKKLGKNFFLQNYKTDRNFPFYFSKIRKVNTKVEEEIFLDVTINKGIYIDIFPLDVCPKNIYGAKVFFKSVEFISFVALSKVSEIYEPGYSKLLAKVFVNMFQLFSLQWLYFLRENIVACIKVVSSGEMICTVGGTHGYPKETYFGDWFDSSTKLTFEGEFFPVPIHWDKLLTSMYGDYMQVPNVEDRKGHFMEEK